jgi:hypothetical protein
MVWSLRGRGILHKVGRSVLDAIVSAFRVLGLGLGFFELCFMILDFCCERFGFRGLGIVVSGFRVSKLSGTGSVLLDFGILGFRVIRLTP